MEKLYERINFENAPSKKTPLGEENLNRMDAGIDGLDDRVIQAYSEIKNVNKAVIEETKRAISKENEIERLFTMPTQEAVDKWLDEHPEATTTVQDGSLETDKFTEDAKLHILKDYATPQMFGAKGDGVTNDTEAFKKAFEHQNIFIPKGRYLVDFWCVNLGSKRIEGILGESYIVQNNSNIPFGCVGYYTQIKGLFFEVKNNTVPTACIVFGNCDGSNARMDRHHISDVNFDCDNNTIPLLYSYLDGDNNGSVGGITENIRIRGCYKGISFVLREGTNHITWITQHVMKNVVIKDPVVYGFGIEMDDKRTQFSHCSFENISVQLSHKDSTGLLLNALATNSYTKITTFHEASFGHNEVTAIDFGETIPSIDYWNNSTIDAIVLEGKLSNVVNGLHYITSGLNLIAYNDEDERYPYIEKLRPISLLRNGDFVGKYDRNVYFVSSAIQSVTLEKDIFERTYLKAVGGSGGTGVLSYNVSKDIPNELNHHGYYTVYAEIDAENISDSKALLYVSNGVRGLDSTVTRFAPSLTHPNRYVLMTTFKMDDDTATKYEIGVRVPKATTIKIYKVDLVVGFQTCAKLID